jgi:hypothetical protein
MERRMRRASLVLLAAVVLAGCSGVATNQPSLSGGRGAGGGSWSFREHREDMAVTTKTTISDQIDGTVTVLKGGTLTLNGRVEEDLIIEVGGRAEVYGMVLGDVVNRGGTLAVFGWVGGSVIKQGGETVVSPGAVVNGSPVP